MEENNVQDSDLNLDFSDIPDLDLEDVQVSEEAVADSLVIETSEEGNVFDDLVETMMPEKGEPEDVAISEEEAVEDINTVPEPFEDEVVAENNYEEGDYLGQYLPEALTAENNFISWYSGNANDPIFEVSKTSESGVLEGDDEWRTIHVNVGYDSYGWVVHFDDGTIMGIDDVREYQLRNGLLPASSGVIVYGSTRIEFKRIERITVYQSVRYFTYG